MRIMASCPVFGVSVLLLLVSVFAVNAELKFSSNRVVPEGRTGEVVNDKFELKDRLAYCDQQMNRVDFSQDAYERRRQQSPPMMKALMLTPAERFCMTRMRILILTSGVTTGLGQGVIGSGLGVLLQTLDLPVGVVSMSHIMNKDAGIWSPYERGDFFMTEGGEGAGEEIGDYERLLNVEMHDKSSYTLGQVVDIAHQLDREGKYFVDAGETRSIILQDMEKVFADVLLRAMLTETFEKSRDNDKEKADATNPRKAYAPAVMILDVGGVTGNANNAKLLGAISRLRHKLEHELAIDTTNVWLPDPEFSIPIDKRFCHVHIVAMPEVQQDSRDMIYPIVKSIAYLADKRLKPDILITRSANPVPNITTISGAALARSLAAETNLDPDQVFFLSEVTDDYQVPISLKNTNVLYAVVKKFDLTYAKSNNTIDKIQDVDQINRLYTMHRRFVDPGPEVRIGLVGKYTLEPKSYVTVTKSIEYAAAMLNVTPKIELIEATFLETKILNTSHEDSKFHREAYDEHWRRLWSVQGIVVAGGASGRGTDGMVEAMQYTREQNIPTLGICLGMQHMVIEFARNVLGFKGADTEETHPELPEYLKVIHKIPELGPDGQEHPRVGGHPTYLARDSIISSLYDGDTVIQQRYAQNFGVNKKFREALESEGMFVTGFEKRSKSLSRRSDVVEFRKNLFHVGVQYHPEFLSDPLKPVRPFLALVAAAIGEDRLLDLRSNGGNIVLTGDIKDADINVFNEDIETNQLSIELEDV